ncbi:MAG: tRNA pseudouridine(55) synthase TruB [Alphaproteobacteria bacterium]|nr:tRNA pseudouridine(55) synthase TruB [Alphaproteobacteria bacterium]
MPKPHTSSPVHGWLALDKPLGLTSTQALGRARRLLGGKKAGHGGTLDPLATGVLPLAFGEATKVIPYVMDGDKEYEFTLRWGEERATGDAEGEVIATSDARPNEAQILAAMPEFIGTIQQKPPAFSAIKVQGERAYDLARAGEKVDLAARDVRIDKFELIDIIDKDSAKFRVSCGKGMYVRSLARDLAEKLGGCGYVGALRRTKVGPFTIENAVSMDELERLSAENAALTALLPIKSALGAIPTLILTPNEANTLRLGQRILIRPQHGTLFEAPLIFAEYDCVPIGLIEAKAGEFRVLRGFHF